MNNPTPAGRSKRIGPKIGAGTSQDGPSSRGSGRHFSKMSTHNSQLKGDAGRTTGGLATSPGAPAPKPGSLLSRGKP